MNVALVQKLYQDIQEKSMGVTRIKADLHVHSPASHDFERNGKPEDEAYIALLDEALDKDIRIIAITDHNTFLGANKMKDIAQKNQKYAGLLILCGIEITCFSKHLIAIFPDSFSTVQQNSFLNEIGLPENFRGTEDAVADNFGPSVLLEIIGKHGGFGILSHADVEKGFLYSLCVKSKNTEEFSYSGKSLAKIIKSPYLFAIQCNSDSNKAKLDDKLHNIDYVRNDRALAFIKCSDCHGLSINGNYCGKSGSALGEYNTEFKLSELSFESVKMALLDADMRLCSECNDDYPFIYGVAIKSPILSSNDEFSIFRFNPELNCIIGSRGTGKTTILETIQSTIMPNSIKGNHRSPVYKRYRCCVVFIKNGSSIYAVSNEPKHHIESYTGEKNYIDNLSIYIKSEKSNRFRSANPENHSFIKDFLAAGYQQRQLYEYSKNPNKILEIVDSFIMWKRPADYSKAISQLNHMEKKLNDMLSSTRKKRIEHNQPFISYVRNNGLEKSLCRYVLYRNNAVSTLSKLRAEMIEELNSVLAGKVILESKLIIKDSEWRTDVESLSHDIKLINKNTYEYYLKIKKALEKAYELSPYAGRFDFYSLLIQGEYEQIRTDYKIELSDTDFIAIVNQINEDHIKARLTDGLRMRYNINTGTNFSANFRDNTQISMGQNAVALLLLILNAAYNMHDTRPLLMDQPEDDLDNSYIYSTLVKEFRTSKAKRQIIISTHNPNIPVAADAECVLVLEFNGKNGFLANVGSIDSSMTANYILMIMEGGEDAIRRRMEKYNIRYGKEK